MTTRVYGASDDLIEFEGDFQGEAGYYDNEGDQHGCLVYLSDGTLLTVKYGKPGLGVWSVQLLRQGSLFERIDICTDEEAVPYSDVAHFKDGIKSAFVATEWE